MFREYVHISKLDVCTYTTRPKLHIHPHVCVYVTECAVLNIEPCKADDQPYTQTSDIKAQVTTVGSVSYHRNR